MGRFLKLLCCFLLVMGELFEVHPDWLFLGSSTAAINCEPDLDQMVPTHCLNEIMLLSKTGRGC